MFGIILSFGAALFEAARDVYLSSAHTTRLPHLNRALLLPLCTIPLVAAVVFVRGIADLESGFWLYVISHAALMLCANYCLLRALAVGTVSQTQPILALTTVFLIVTTPLLTNDYVTLWGWVGVLLVALGIYATQHPGDMQEKKRASLWTPLFTMWREPGAVWMLLTAFIYSITANIDKLGVLASDGPTYLFIDYSLTALMTAGFIGIGVATKRISSAQAVNVESLLLFVPGGAFNAVTSLVQMWALTLLPVPYVIALKRLSIVFASLWGYFIRKERAPHHIRLLGVFVAVGGVAIILLFGRI